MHEDDTPIGHIRLAYDSIVWQISYSIAQAYRGQGHGKIILQHAEDELIRVNYVAEKLFAEVKKDNIASQRIFKKLCYSETTSQHDNVYVYTKLVTKAQTNGIE